MPDIDPIFAEGAIAESLCIQTINACVFFKADTKYKKYGQHFIYAAGITRLHKIYTC
jgi:hypothetical protein